MEKLQEALQVQADALDAARRSMLLQMQPATATWALSRWEKTYGVPTRADYSDERRQQNLIARIRTNQTLTKDALRNIIKAYTNGGDVEIIEYASEYRFLIKFVGQYGIPPYMDDVMTAVHNFKPAHLQAEYAYDFYLISRVQGMTIAEMDATTMDKFAGGTNVN